MITADIPAQLLQVYHRRVRNSCPNDLKSHAVVGLLAAEGGHLVLQTVAVIIPQRGRSERAVTVTIGEHLGRPAP